MKILYLFIACFILSTPSMLFDFDLDVNTSAWRIVDDVVMGGRSNGQFEVTKEGHGFIHGYVSLENNGGYSSVRYRFKEKEIKGFTKVIIRLKGDGNRYQFRAKTSSYDRYSYIQYFETNGEWQTIEIALEDMYPTFRGRKLRMPNFPGEKLGEIAFLIGNKEEQSFQLSIDYIQLQ